MKKCPNPKCEPHFYFNQENHCPLCGTALVHTHLTKCKKCDDITMPEDKYCRHCGADLSVG